MASRWPCAGLRVRMSGVFRHEPSGSRETAYTSSCLRRSPHTSGQESESASQTPRWHLKRNQLGTPMWPHTAPLSRRLWRSPPARCVFLLDTLVSQAQVRCQRRAGAWTWQGSVPPPRSMSASCAYPRRFEVWGCWIRRTICHADVRCECPHIRACGGTLDACLTYPPSFWSRT